ncbi:hypothetical protein TNCV_2196991 [Trichonephila clavipes]|nr:hypothetical protein TNCV_2196991 [Trichonephila clavipes]
MNYGALVKTVLGCYGQIGPGGRERLWWPANEKGREACCGPWCLKRGFFFQDTGEKRPALDPENLRGEPWMERTLGEL